jgi:hypothetical protein
MGDQIRPLMPISSHDSKIVNQKFADRLDVWKKLEIKRW